VDGIILEEYVVRRSRRRRGRRRVQRANILKRGDTTGRRKSIMVNSTIIVGNHTFCTEEQPYAATGQIEVVMVNTKLLHGSGSVEPDHKISPSPSGDVEPRNAVEFTIGPRQVAVHPQHCPSGSNFATSSSSTD